MAPGLRTQLPAGKLVRVTLPVGIVQVGCELGTATGASGVDGCAIMTTLAEGAEIHPAAVVTVKL